MIRVIIEGIGIDPSKQPVILLKEINSERILPIWIGHAESRAIELEMRGAQPERPMSHDLLLATIHMAHAKVLQVIINDLQESTFYATIDIETQQGIQHIDSRPSDALALAIRAGCPIFVDGNAADALADASEPIGHGHEATGSNPDTQIDEEDSEEIQRFKRLLGELGDTDEE